MFPRICDFAASWGKRCKETWARRVAFKSKTNHLSNFIRVMSGNVKNVTARLDCVLRGCLLWFGGVAILCVCFVSNGRHETQARRPTAESCHQGGHDGRGPWDAGEIDQLQRFPCDHVTRLAALGRIFISTRFDCRFRLVTTFLQHSLRFFFKEGLIAGLFFAE